ncbi:fatty acid desaturase-domain-containing protein [Lipomyces kononenkoae]|uniref:Fatty acid desaturase-domain-containing protein n=1 Tax=Lipomyces kononenkoae TaxID=34357 RepID=A0ACC3SXC7_LIPKO
MSGEPYPPSNSCTISWSLHCICSTIIAEVRQTAMVAKDMVLSRAVIEGMIADGNVIVIYENLVLRVDAWLPRHPGGDKIVFHMVGRDATDEINAYHSEETRTLARKYQIGRVEGTWKNFIPPIQGGKFRKLKQIDEAVSLTDESLCGSSDDDDGVCSTGACARAKSTTFRTKSASAEETCENMEIADIIYSPKLEEIPVSASLFAEYERKLVERDLEKYPSLDYDTQLSITRKYRELENKLVREGYFQCTYWGYARECIRYLTLASLAYYFLSKQWYLTSAFFLGLLWHQLAFTVHDAGHLAITHSFFWDNVIGVIVANYIGGLSLGWWKRNHNVHHVVTNDPVHDPDIQHLPFFAVSTKFFGDLSSTYYDRLLKYDAVAKAMIQVQHWMYYPILCFGRFNLYRLSWEYLLLGQGPRKGQAAWLRYFELVGMMVFWYWFGYKLVYQQLPSAGVRIGYVLISHVVTMPLHVQITLSHFAMSTTDLGASESFAQKMLRTTMDVDCPAWFDFFHGGLQFQAVHHLFPRMPRHNFRAAQKHVIEFCNEVGVQYCIYGFVDGNKEVISRLGDIAKQASIFADCSNHMMQEAVATGKI